MLRYYNPKRHVTRTGEWLYIFKVVLEEKLGCRISICSHEINFSCPYIFFFILHNTWLLNREKYVTKSCDIRYRSVTSKDFGWGLYTELEVPDPLLGSGNHNFWVMYNKGRADRRRNPLPSDKFSLKISCFCNLPYTILYCIFDNVYSISTDQLANHAYRNKM